MGNLNCIYCLGDKPVSGDVNNEAKHNHGADKRNQLWIKRSRRTSKEGDANYFSSIKIFNTSKRSSKSKESGDDWEGYSSCAACSTTVTTNDRDNGGGGESVVSCEKRSLLRPPFKPLETPSGALLDLEVTLIKV